MFNLSQLAKREEESLRKLDEILETGLRAKSENENLKIRIVLAKEAMEAFLAKLNLIHADENYQAVWTIAHAHYGPYTGPTYVEEMGKLKDAIATLQKPE